MYLINRLSGFGERSPLYPRAPHRGFCPRIRASRFQRDFWRRAWTIATSWSEPGRRPGRQQSGNCTGRGPGASAPGPLPAWTLTFPGSGSALQGIARKIQEAHVPTKGWTLQLKRKLLQAMRARDKRFPLEGIVQINDAYSGGQRRGGKRGRTGCACAGCGASARPPCGAGPSVISSRARGSIPTGCAASAAWPRPAVSTW